MVKRKKFINFIELKQKPKYRGDINHHVKQLVENGKKYGLIIHGKKITNELKGKLIKYLRDLLHINWVYIDYGYNL